MHASFGFFFAALNHFIPKATFVPGMAILTSATLLMELLRYRKTFSWMNDILHFVLGSSLRKHEMDGKFTGSFYYFLGVTVTAALYPTSCATLGICQLAIADPTASYFGRATRHVYWSRIEKCVQLASLFCACDSFRWNSFLTHTPSSMIVVLEASDGTRVFSDSSVVHWRASP